MLLFDRYLSTRRQTLDLATGAAVRHLCEGREEHPPGPLFERRRGWWLIDVEERGADRTAVWERWPAPLPLPGPSTVALVAALEGAKEGRPHAVDLVAGPGTSWERAVREAARHARLAGFVPIGADVLGEVLAAARWHWPHWLRERSLVVITRDGHLSAHATLALLRLATRDTRPHVLIRGASSDTAWQPRFVAAPRRVHDGVAPVSMSRVHATSVEGLVARAWQQAPASAVSDPETTARWALLLASTLDLQATARCAVARALVRKGRVLEARAALAPLTGVATMSAAVGAMADDVRAELQRAECAPRKDSVMVSDCLDVLRLCQDMEDEHLALARVSALLRDRVAATTTAFMVHDRGKPQVVAQAGAGVPGSDMVGRVIESGVATTPAAGGMPIEGAWPVRYGAAVVGALWCRWATGLAVLSDDASALLGMAATASAPNLHAVAERLRRPAPLGVDAPQLVGDSDVMQELRRAVLRAAVSPFAVLIEGESGSGKELVARLIHQSSRRRDRQFCALNCAALADELVEAELFGHTRGAFTGASAERIGLFETARDGTLFLDEVAELGPRVQAKLLRVLQEGEVRRLGESALRKVDVRIVAATNRPLEQEVEQGRFRRDLRYRLDVVRVVVPPLRERLDDIPELVRHVWARLCQRTGSRAVLSPGALSALGRYDWPGNVRELQNVLASMIVAGPVRGAIGAHAMPAHVGRVAALGPPASLHEARRQFEARFVRAALARAGGKAGIAARDLGVSRQGLSKLVCRLGIGGHEAGPAMRHVE